LSDILRTTVEAIYIELAGDVRDSCYSKLSQFSG